MKYEVFNPLDGIPTFTTRSRIIAKFIAWFRGEDYAQQHSGWIADGDREYRRIGAEATS